LNYRQLELSAEWELSAVLLISLTTESLFMHFPTLWLAMSSDLNAFQRCLPGTCPQYGHFDRSKNDTNEILNCHVTSCRLENIMKRIPFMEHHNNSYIESDLRVTIIVYWKTVCVTYVWHLYVHYSHSYTFEVLKFLQMAIFAFCFQKNNPVILYVCSPNLIMFISILYPQEDSKHFSFYFITTLYFYYHLIYNTQSFLTKLKSLKT